MDIKRFKMLHFNYLLFNNMNSIFGMTQESFSMKVYGSIHRYKQRLLFPDRLLVTDLVQLCNHLHISVSHFFTIEPATTFIQEQSFYVIRNNFVPITFKNSTITDLYGKKGLAGKITRDEIAEKLGITSTTLYLWARKQEMVKISSLLMLCNQLNVPLSLFLDDKNKPLVEVPKEDETYLSKEIIVEIKQLQALVTKSQKEISRLKKEVEHKRLTTPADYQELATFASQASEEYCGLTSLRLENEQLRSENERLKNKISSLHQLVHDMMAFVPENNFSILKRIKEILPELEA